jgi:hypothetical protein
MTVIFRPITNEDIDHLFALEEVDKFKKYLVLDFDYARGQFLDLGCQIAKDDKSHNYIVKFFQGDRLDMSYRYILVCDGKIILSKAMYAPLTYEVEYISPELIARLEELTRFMREAFSNGGDCFFKRFADESDRVLGSQMNFVLINQQGA